jgi:hypothetical protein
MGSNYGGFLAGSLLAHRQERLLKCGVLLAPIVDWRLTGTSSRVLCDVYCRLEAHRYKFQGSLDVYYILKSHRYKLQGSLDFYCRLEAHRYKLQGSP